jgi:hypothetical protein
VHVVGVDLPDGKEASPASLDAFEQKMAACTAAGHPWITEACACTQEVSACRLQRSRFGKQQLRTERVVIRAEDGGLHCCWSEDQCHPPVQPEQPARYEVAALLDLVNNQMKVVLLGKAAVRDEGLPWITEACACTQEDAQASVIQGRPSSRTAALPRSTTFI